MSPWIGLTTGAGTIVHLEIWCTRLRRHSGFDGRTPPELEDRVTIRRAAQTVCPLR